MLPEVSHVCTCIYISACLLCQTATFPLLCTHNANKAFSSLSCSLSFPIFVSMAARAVAYSEPSCCSDGLQSSKAGKVGEEQEDRRSPAGMDYVRRSVLVEVGTLSLIVAICCVANRCFSECYIPLLALFECTDWLDEHSIICTGDHLSVPDLSMWAVQSLKRSEQRSCVNFFFFFFCLEHRVCFLFFFGILLKYPSCFSVAWRFA